MPKKSARKKASKKSSRAKFGRHPKKKAKKRPKTVAKPSKTRRTAEKMPKKETEASIYEEVTITCPGCGRISKVIKLSGVDTEGLICQRCAKGEIELEEMDF